MIRHRRSGHPAQARCLTLLLACVATWLCGCAEELPTKYGNSTGPVGQQSINGFGALRDSLIASGWSTRKLTTLSDRMNGLDAVVWMPNVLISPRPDEMLWLADWLRQRPRTLVYVLCDPGSESDYWETMSSQVDAGQKSEYERRAAEHLSKVMTEFTWGTRPQPLLVDHRWFSTRYRPLQVPSWEILPHDPASDSITPPSPFPHSQPEAARKKRPASPSAGPVSGIDEIDGDEYFEADWLRFETLVASEDGVPLAIRLTSNPNQTRVWHRYEDRVAAGAFDSDAPVIPDSTFGPGPNSVTPQATGTPTGMIGQSEVIVIAGGALINNFAVLKYERPQGRELVRRLITEMAQRTVNDPPRAGLIHSDSGGLEIDSEDEKPSVGLGSEWLTIWPISLVTLHMALIGVIACLVMLPIFGRARRDRDEASSDFADHIRAVAQLMRRTGGEATARAKIRDYFRKIRGETAGPWATWDDPAPTNRSTPIRSIQPQSRDQPPAGKLGPRASIDDPSTP
jgi:hypothetical protein